MGGFFRGVSDVQVQISLSGCPTTDFCLELLFFCSSTDLIVIFGLASLLHPWYCRSSLMVDFK